MLRKVLHPFCWSHSTPSDLAREQEEDARVIPALGTGRCLFQPLGHQPFLSKKRFSRRNQEITSHFHRQAASLLSGKMGSFREVTEWNQVWSLWACWGNTLLAGIPGKGKHFPSWQWSARKSQFIYLYRWLRAVNPQQWDSLSRYTQLGNSSWRHSIQHLFTGSIINVLVL